MNGIRTYQDTAVTTQSKGRIIVMLYEGAVKFLKLAIAPTSVRPASNSRFSAAISKSAVWILIIIVQLS